jgi:hypothetical protein
MAIGKDFKPLAFKGDDGDSGSLFHARGAAPPGFVTWIARLLAFGAMLVLAILLMIHIRH